MMLELLPEKGALLTMTNKRNIIKKIDFSSEEMEKFEIKQNKDNGTITWRNEIEPFDIDFNSEELNLLKEQVEQLDKANEISDRNFDLCIKIKEA